VQIAEKGIQNILKYFHVIEGKPLTSGTRLMEIPGTEYYSYANSAGIYEAFFALGENVEAGQTLGQIHYPAEPQREPELIVARRTGMLAGTRGPGFVEKGDCVALIAKDL
jgi:predicted deacylase